MLPNPAIMRNRSTQNPSEVKKKNKIKVSFSGIVPISVRHILTSYSLKYQKIFYKISKSF